MDRLLYLIEQFMMRTIDVLFYALGLFICLGLWALAFLGMWKLAQVLL